MNLNIFPRALLVPVVAVLLVSACSTVKKVAPGQDKVDYKKSKVTESLEVPPDLSSNTINDAPDSLDAATYSEYGDSRIDVRNSAVLPAQSNMRVERDGDQQWLVVRGTPAQVWPRVKEFWLQEGFLIRMEDPRVGIIETNWAENRADIPQGPIRNLLGKVLDSVYSSATRDQFRVRLENGTQPDTTEVFLTHRGMQEVMVGGAADATPVWEPRATDPELEAEMLKRLMVYMGVEEQKAQTMLAQQSDEAVRAQLVSDASGTMLLVYEDFSRAWRRTGIALDRVGFAVEDRNRSEGTYYVRYSDPLAGEDKGMLSKLAFWSSDDSAAAKQYHIKLVASGATTQVIVDDAQGVRDTTATGKRILTLLEEQLR
ncbi:MAG: outer membrane protein assembly factor BamC [Gammaproteobacteria bacterium]|jgi:outer membrane protein assembly factor BamC